MRHAPACGRWYLAAAAPTTPLSWPELALTVSLPSICLRPRARLVQNTPPTHSSSFRNFAVRLIASTTNPPACPFSHPIVPVPLAARQELKSLSESSPECAALVSKIDIQCADFFAFEGDYDLVWDCTFLCALVPAVREQWAAKYKSLLRPDGTLLTCVFPLGKPPGGPPFEITVPLVGALLRPVGFEPTEVNENLPPDELHTPGGAAQFGTAFAAWKLKQ